MVGRVIQVGVSPGGVPKLPVERAWVGHLGLDGDAHREDTVHGGPHRAVCLFALEAIRRVAAEGHPIFPGSAGENLTTEGIEWAGLPVGTRAEIGAGGLVLEISKPDMPCDTIAGSFRDERSGRISILTHPLDSRMYARVLAEGEVRTGDTIRIRSPEPDSLAATHELLDRIEAARRSFKIALWKAIAVAGFDIRIVDDGELALVAAPDLPGPTFNRALGHRQLPNLLPRMFDWFRANGTVGWISAQTSPWAGAIGERPSTWSVAAPEAVQAAAPAPGQPLDGLSIREIGPSEGETFARLFVEASAIEPGQAPAWLAALPRLVGTAGHHYYLADLDGDAVAVGSLVVRRKVGLLGQAAVRAAARGRGIQRALITHRSIHAAEHGANVIAAGTTTGSRSAANVEAMGLRPIWETALYRFDPADPAG